MGRRKAGRKIALIESEGECVQLLEPPRSRIPCWRIIVAILNTALMEQFGLEVSLAMEGGLKHPKNKLVDLRNFTDYLGLWSHYGKNDSVQEILKWYAEVLKDLLGIEPLADGNRHNLIIGTILSEGNIDTVVQLVALSLWAQTRDEEFPRRVIQRLNKIKINNPAMMPFLVGRIP